MFEEGEEMAYYAKAKGGIPFHKREEERRWKDHISKHKKSVQTVKPTIANKNDLDKHIHMRLKLKRIQLHEDRIATIEYENRRLLENITRIERKPNKEFWNEPYLKKTQKVEESSDDEMEDSETEENTDNESEDDFETREAKLREREIKRQRREKSKEERLAKKEARLEHYNRLGILDELKADKALDENKKLEKRLNQMLKKFQEEKKNSKENPEVLDERINALREAREALRKENEVIDDKSQSKGYGDKSTTPRDGDERVKENKRLHKKLQEIQQGKGRKKPNDPEYDGLSRWWVTSPRGRDKTEYERERQKFIEEQKLSREQQKIEREKEEQELMKKQKAEAEKEKVPEGYRKKKKKKKSTTVEPKKEDLVSEEDLPDTSILTKNPYGDNQSESDDEKHSRDNKKGKMKASPYKSGGNSKNKGRKKINSRP